MKSTQKIDVKTLIITALLVGFGILSTPVVLAQTIPNHQEQNEQNSQDSEGHGEHGEHHEHHSH